jgi:3-oxoadipate enol-lactonase
MEQHCDDFAALLDVIGIADPVHLVGTSYGGEVAMEFAIRYPERTRSLTVIACVARPDAELLAKARAGREASLNAPETLYDISAGDFFSPEFAAANQALMASSRARVASLPREFFDGYAALCDSFAKLDVLDRLSAIRCPTLVIAAAGDRLKPVRFSRDIAARIAGAELRVVENSGHAAVVEQPGAIDELVANFLSRLP